MKAILVYTNQHQRFYKLSIKVTKFCNPNFNLVDEIKYKKTRIKPEYLYLIPDVVDGWDIICISDAHTHNEHLAFLGIYCKHFSEPYSRFSSHQIDGIHTMMTTNGNVSTMKPDAVYLTRLANVNNLKFEGIENPFNLYYGIIPL